MVDITKVTKIAHIQITYYSVYNEISKWLFEYGIKDNTIGVLLLKDLENDINLAFPDNYYTDYDLFYFWFDFSGE